MTFDSFMIAVKVHGDDLDEFADNQKSPANVVANYQDALMGEIDNVTDTFGVKIAILGKYLLHTYGAQGVPDDWTDVEKADWLAFYEKEVEFMRRTRLFDIQV
ncbi:expressed unknown protein [Seminavis robusta]|uniref:Uncharacterized protein n=1 Tax=Seminavis robusta TaxID=568900 RepID=A0A9N8EL71_9STRA|nr:expressed unknown protein [Seminavis robusta]|eukprot:Sro1164_g248030.1 n/a (103) ;mRNA; f:17604-17912